MKTKIGFKNFLLLSMLILGLFLRTYQLGTIPSGFFADEAVIGYNAYKILTTGKDMYGYMMPFFFKDFGDYDHPLATYTDIPFIALGGLNEAMERAQSVFWGIVTIIFLYLIGKELFNDRVGLWAAFFAATAPWFIHYNRVGFNYSVYVAFFTMSIYFLTKCLKSSRYIIPWFIFSALTIYTSQPAKFFGPLLLSFIFLFPSHFFGKRIIKTLIGIFIFLIISIPFILTFFQDQAFYRFKHVSVFTSNLPFAKTLEQMTINYFMQLNPYYLFWGEEPTFITRHFVKGLHPLLLVTLPLILVGVYLLIKNLKLKSTRIILFWLIIYPIAGAITLTGPFTGRSMIGAPLFCLISAVGISQIIKLFREDYVQRLVSVVVTLIVLINLMIFLNFYYNVYPKYSSDFWGWQYGARDIVNYFSKNQDKYDELLMTPEFNAPEIFFKFYSPTDCSKCRIGLPDSSYNPTLNQLFALTPNYLMSNPQFQMNVIKTIYYPNNTIAFKIGKVIKR